MLTISQLARYTGVTVRAIRHYHQCGLLPEPPRDHSGYRRYDAQSVVTVTRVKALSQAGVPLSRIPAVLEAGPEELRSMISELDAELGHKISKLEDTRLRLQALTASERPYVTDDIAAHLLRLADLGLTDDQIALERDTWGLLLALYPRHISGWVARADELLNDDDIARLYIDIHQARSLLPDDSRIAQLAGRAAQLSQRHARQQNSTLDMKHDADAFRLVSDHGLALSPAWLRLTELGQEALTRT